jgi:hypothetical protein
VSPLATDLDESVAQFIGVCKLFCAHFPDRVIVDLPGISVVLSGRGVFFHNSLVVSAPVRDAADLERRTRLARELVGRDDTRVLLVLCAPWAPGGDAAAAREILAGLGFEHVMRTTGMVADQLAPPRRPAPAIALRPVDDDATRTDISDLNAVCNDLPAADGRATWAHEAHWRGPHFAWLGYHAGQPITSANTTIVDGRLYVSFVATRADHRREGHGEAIMRHSLARAMAASGLRRTCLHASESGLSIYQAMGYRTVGEFDFYAPVR